MTGAELYNRWVEAMENEGIEVEEMFEELSDARQGAWTHVAIDLKEKS